LILAVAGPAYWNAPTNPDNLRTSEKELVNIYHNDENDLDFLAIYDLTYLTKMQALFSILTTLVVCCVLMFGSLILTRTMTELLINPIETMI
jgi:hypothetical protein